MSLKNRLTKLEGQRPVVASTDHSEQSKLDILWGVAANGSGSVQIQAIKTLNDMRFDNQVVEKDERSEEEIRGHIEQLIEEYRAMPVI
jgi:hypothetical protein